MKNLWKILVVLLLIPIVFLGVVYLNEYKSNIEESEQIIGLYKFNYQVSEFYKLEKKDSLLFDSLYLKFNDDHTFEFNHSVPHILGVTGNWEAEGFGMNDYINLKMTTGSIYQIGNCCGNYNEITMSYVLNLNDTKSCCGTLGFIKLDNAH